ncbi:hypothetical protein GCM10020220_042530 [Nonomuraea rubra]
MARTLCSWSSPATTPAAPSPATTTTVLLKRRISGSLPPGPFVGQTETMAMTYELGEIMAERQIEA